MSCCGQQRRSISNITNQASWKGKAIRVKYLGARPITVVGPTTGQKYTFSGIKRYQEVDPKDASGILRNSFFRMQGVVQKVES